MSSSTAVSCSGGGEPAPDQSRVEASLPPLDGESCSVVEEGLRALASYDAKFGDLSADLSRLSMPGR